MKNKICLIIPYFGKLPKYADLFFESLRNNDNIDVLMITDATVKYELKNLKILRMSFDALRNKIQEKFPFKISLEKPYKLCDFRPAYGYIFQEYLTEYTFWGYSDIDLVFGKTSIFLTEELLSKYDKIYQHGHFCLYRNVTWINEEFMSNYGIDYKKVFSSSINYIFDELLGIQKKFDYDRISTYKGWEFFDVNPWKYHLTRVTSYVPSEILTNDFDFKHECFYIENGHLYREALKGDRLIKSEFLYFHFQKRNYTINNKSDNFYLTNNGTLDVEKSISSFNIDEYNKFSTIEQIKLNLRKQQFVWKRRIKKYLFKKG
ncbi:hypothetical protein N4562_06445 [Ligilactobacillus agilis]|uniref:Uncharacterized protein n=1 Tax=Ligilactobacillus agilis TaxID=1601 RepID=A0A9Q9J2H3_9LACO|nr:DUF6625 family protein [Ligilactobacillus agilis]UXC62737.1 hypothetical protein N4562_06445 [Ligilactobacillus agilis]UXC64736.1 hypothetical protein N4597_06440 [Ligilactobacillus agilis]